MSKSKGGFTTLQTLIDAGVHPLAYRLMCLSAHYRSELEFSGENLLAALTRLKRLVIAAERFLAKAGPEPDEWTPGAAALAYLQRLDEAVADDLNTPRALPVLDEVLGDKKLPAADRRPLLAAFDAVLGLDLLTLDRAALRVRPKDAALTADDVEARLSERREARVARDFARGDAIRDALAAAGVEVMDGDPLGWDWRPELD